MWVCTLKNVNWTVCHTCEPCMHYYVYSSLNIMVFACACLCKHPRMHTLFKLLQTSGCMHGSRVMHTVPSVYYTYTYTHDIQDACVVHKWCTLFQPTIPGECHHIHTTLCTDYTNYCRHSWARIVQKWCWLLEFTIKSVYTHICTGYPNYYRHQAACMVHKRRTPFESTIPREYSTYTPHNTQTTT